MGQVRTHTQAVCTLEWLDVFMGISTQASTGGTTHSEEAWLAASSLIQALCPDPVPGGQRQPP